MYCNFFQVDIPHLHICYRYFIYTLCTGALYDGVMWCAYNHVYEEEKMCHDSIDKISFEYAYRILHNSYLNTAFKQIPHQK